MLFNIKIELNPGVPGFLFAYLLPEFIWQLAMYKSSILNPGTPGFIVTTMGNKDFVDFSYMGQKKLKAGVPEFVWIHLLQDFFHN